MPLVSNNVSSGNAHIFSSTGKSWTKLFVRVWKYCIHAVSSALSLTIATSPLGYWGSFCLCARVSPSDVSIPCSSFGLHLCQFFLSNLSSLTKHLILALSSFICVTILFNSGRPLGVHFAWKERSKVLNYLIDSSSVVFIDSNDLTLLYGRLRANANYWPLTYLVQPVMILKPQHIEIMINAFSWSQSLCCKAMLNKKCK